MTIESFTYSEQDGTGDIYYTLDLKEYKKPAIKVKQKVISKTSTKIETASTKRVSKQLDQLLILLNKVITYLI
jgi:hypothetical protein